MTEIGYVTKNMSIQAYRKMKIKMLEKEFCVPLTPEQKEHLNELKTEIAIDNYARTILRNHWN